MGVTDRVGIPDEHAASARGHDLVPVERVRRKRTPCTGVSAHPCSADSLGRILDQRHIEATAGFRDAVELRGLAVEVDNDDRSRQSTLGIGPFECVLEQVRIDVPRGRLRVDEPQIRSEVAGGVGGCDEGERRNPHFVTGTHTMQQKRQNEARPSHSKALPLHRLRTPRRHPTRNR